MGAVCSPAVEEPPDPADPVIAEAPADATAELRRMRGATAVFAGATVLSRVAGLVRETATAYFFGVGTVMSAFTVAFQIPNLIRSLLADAALNAAFVPKFTELKEHGEEERAWRVASTFIALILLVLGPITILCMWAAPWIVELFVTGKFTGTGLAVDLFRIMMPIVLLFAWSGVVVGILNTYDHFSSAALAPVAWNLVILLALLAIVPHVEKAHQIHVYAIAIVIGTVVQTTIPVPWMRGKGGRITAALSLRDPAVKAILITMLPVTIGLGLINLNLLINTFFSTNIPAHLLAGDPDAGPAALDKAFRLYILPQGIFSVAVSTVFFPVLARFAARKDMDGFRATFADGTRQIFILLLPATAFMLALAEPIIGLLYQHGNFSAQQTPIVADALIGFSFGLVFNGASLLLIRSFFSLKSPWMPTFVNLGNLIGNAAIVWSLHGKYGVLGIATATSVVNAVSFCAMYVILQRRIGRLGTRRTIETVALAAIASGLSALAALGAWHLVDDVFSGGLIPNAVAMLIAFFVAVVVYLLLVVQLRVIGGNELKRLLLRR
jgi:putative peptidoglycan lipid II flippase